MKENSGGFSLLFSVVKYIMILLLAAALAAGVSVRMLDLAGVNYTSIAWEDLSHTISGLEEDVAVLAEDRTAEELAEELAKAVRSPLEGKKIVYDGDSIAESRSNNGGGYPALIAELTGSTYENFARSGARLASNSERHSVVDNLENLPKDADLYCFEGGINDFWANTPLGTWDRYNFDGPLDTNTVCGALETVFRYCLDNLPGKPVCFVITHKIQMTAYSPNAYGNTFEDYRDAMVGICRKYSIPYYDAFSESGLNGWNQTQSDLYLTACESGLGDGCHPNAEGYKRYYVPQLLDLFERILPAE